MEILFKINVHPIISDSDRISESMINDFIARKYPDPHYRPYFGFSEGSWDRPLEGFFATEKVLPLAVLIIDADIDLNSLARDFGINRPMSTDQMALEMDTANAIRDELISANQK